MNSKIEELINQATAKERIRTPNPETFEIELKEPPIYGDVFNKEKFAKLIIMECGNFIASELTSKIGQLSAAMVATDLVEHFGIK